eukprot:snap_masked-scaffold_15-processed-gene-6.32-mRNA-1 protein AED:0.02 eAED:0.02 QI:0/-1/0/1/-1/1/1/0/388
MKLEKAWNFLNSLDLIHCSLFLTTWSLSIVAFKTTELCKETSIFSFIFLCVGGMGVTCGYHRYWSHRSYEAKRGFQVFLLFCATTAVQGSCKWWCRGHRVHHRYTDTDKDPYSAHKGLFWSHLGWMLFKPNPENYVKIDISDLKKDWILELQHKYYGVAALFCSFVLPTMICGYGWGDFQGGFFYAGVVRLVMLHNMTFSINSLAHYMGDQPFDDRLTPRDNLLTAFLTWGEGYHNFHHEFPRDYRNGIRFFDYDPSKWFIYGASLLGLTFELRKFDDNEIRKGKYQMRLKSLKKEKETIEWPVSRKELPEMSLKEFKAVAKEKGYVIFNKVVHDVKKFIPEHPGGEKLLKAYIGKDVTGAFRGEVYNHSNGAENLLGMMRIAKLKVD